MREKRRNRATSGGRGGAAGAAGASCVGAVGGVDGSAPPAATAGIRAKARTHARLDTSGLGIIRLIPPGGANFKGRSVEGGTALASRARAHERAEGADELSVR